MAEWQRNTWICFLAGRCFDIFQEAQRGFRVKLLKIFGLLWIAFAVLLVVSGFQDKKALAFPGFPGFVLFLIAGSANDRLNAIGAALFRAVALAEQERLSFGIIEVKVILPIFFEEHFKTVVRHRVALTRRI